MVALIVAPGQYVRPRMFLHLECGPRADPSRSCVFHQSRYSRTAFCPSPAVRDWWGPDFVDLVECLKRPRSRREFAVGENMHIERNRYCVGGKRCRRYEISVITLAYPRPRSQSSRLPLQGPLVSESWNLGRTRVHLPFIRGFTYCPRRTVRDTIPEIPEQSTPRPIGAACGDVNK